jgi:hypothetical protein
MGGLGVEWGDRFFGIDFLFLWIFSRLFMGWAGEEMVWAIATMESIGAIVFWGLIFFFFGYFLVCLRVGRAKHSGEDFLSSGWIFSRMLRPYDV